MENGSGERSQAYSARPKEVKQLMQDISFEFPGSLSPEAKHEGIVMFAKDVEKTLIDSYGKYIPEKGLKEKLGNDKRLIIGDLEQFYSQFAEGWTGEEDTRAIPEAFRTHLGRLIFLHPPDHYWDTLPADEKTKRIAYFGSEDEARSEEGLAVFLNLAGHEIVHNFQNDSLPLWLMECGASYYQHQVNETLDLPQLLDPLNAARREKYASIVQKYGGAAHSLFFGDTLEPNISEEIEASISEEEFRALFPAE